MEQQFLTGLQNLVGEENIRQMEPMSRHTTFRVGGPADVLVSATEENLAGIIALCREYGENYYVIGNGSNLLVGDGGIRGVVITLLTSAESVKVDENHITAGAGMLLSKVAHIAAEHTLTGMEFAAGIPGSIGGAVVMNAGAYGGEMKDIIESVTVVDPEGSVHVLGLEELELGYRTSCILKKGYIVTKAVLRLTPGDQEQILAVMKDLKEKRQEKQPLEYPSAGSTFKRPEGYFAGKLIMDAGLRGYTVGGAQVSEKHCGFVINRGGATAADVCRLISDVAEKVKAEFGVTLEPEVKMIGEFLH